MTRVAVLSLHTSPLVLPGRGDAGGMNVYVRELVSSLAQTGVDATVFVRRWDRGSPEVVDVEPGFQVVHVAAGSPDLPKEALPQVVDEFADQVRGHLTRRPTDVLHANYWLSGVAGHRLKHDLDLPLVSTFHTLARVKAATGDPEPHARIKAEAEVIACSDVITANSDAEAQQLATLYRAPMSRIHKVTPGVDRAFFSPGSQHGARQALGIREGPVLLFVGRIQPLKGAVVAVETLAALSADYPRAHLLIVGGASGEQGHNEMERLRQAIAANHLQQRVTLVPPQPHHLLSTYYRAADVCLVPSRSESFGLVALEASACGIPVVAADVGGLRTLVKHGLTGYRIPERSPRRYAEATSTILEDANLAESMSRHGAQRAEGYTWSATAARLRRTLADLARPARASALVDCTAS